MIGGNNKDEINNDVGKLLYSTEPRSQCGGLFPHPEFLKIFHRIYSFNHYFINYIEVEHFREQKSTATTIWL